MILPKLDRVSAGRSCSSARIFGVAADGREGRPQLVACVGNEIDAHPFGSDDIGSVEHSNQDCLI